jgi:hypothetical protein
MFANEAVEKLLEGSSISFWGSTNPSQHVDHRMLRILIVPFLFIDNQIFDQVVFLQLQQN